MKPVSLFTLVGIATLASAPAMAATTYATSITTNGETFAVDDSNVDMSTSRTNPYNALGAPDDDFYSVGLGNSVDFEFGEEFTGPGAIYEVTFGRNGYLESADLSVSDNGSDFVDIASIDNQNGGTVNFDFDGTWSVLRLTDTSGNPPSEDGFDVDSVGVSPVPVPASALLLGGGLAGLAGLRRKRKTA